MLRSLGAKVYVCPAHVSADDERSYYSNKRLLEEKGLFILIGISMS
jgi:cystathionine beta-synthase